MKAKLMAALEGVTIRYMGVPSKIFVYVKF